MAFNYSMGNPADLSIWIFAGANVLFFPLARETYFCLTDLLRDGLVGILLWGATLPHCPGTANYGLLAAQLHGRTPGHPRILLSGHPKSQRQRLPSHRLAAVER